MSWGSSCLSILLSVAQMVTPSTVDMWFVQRWGLISEPTWAQRSAGVGLIAEKIPRVYIWNSAWGTDGARQSFTGKSAQHPFAFVCLQQKLSS